MRVNAVGRPLLSVGDEGSAFVGWYAPDELAALPLAPADARFVLHLWERRKTASPE